MSDKKSPAVRADKPKVELYHEKAECWPESHGIDTSQFEPLKHGEVIEAITDWVRDLVVETMNDTRFADLAWRSSVQDGISVKLFHVHEIDNHDSDNAYPDRTFVDKNIRLEEAVRRYRRKKESK